MRSTKESSPVVFVAVSAGGVLSTGGLGDVFVTVFATIGEFVVDLCGVWGVVAVLNA